MTETSQSPDDKPAPRPAGVLLSLAPLVLLALFLIGSIATFGDATTGGPAQLALLMAGLAAGVIGLWRGHGWKELEEKTYEVVARAMPIVFILLAIGLLIGLWIAAGVIPALIYYSLQLISPALFYLATLILCALVSISIGSSWTTAGTIGLALVSAAQIAGLPAGIVAGAVISGAYFGDKLSPLSDTTNLAAGLTGTELFAHIRFLLWTTLPAFAVALIGFAILSFGVSAEVEVTRITQVSGALDESFSVSPLLLLPLAITLALAAFRVSAFAALIIGGLVGGVFGLLFQPALTADGFGAGLAALASAAANGFVSQTGVEQLDSLLSRGGMESFLTTIWLILSAMFFGGMMEKSGSLDVIVRLMIAGVKTGGGLMQRAGLTALLANIVTPDQFLAIAAPSQMYRKSFEEAGLETKSLSRVLEDFGTVTSPLVPWNTCGAYMAATLGVATFAYAPYAFFNLASPVISFIFAGIGFQVARRAMARPGEASAQQG